MKIDVRKSPENRWGSLVCGRAWRALLLLALVAPAAARADAPEVSAPPVAVTPVDYGEIIAGARFGFPLEKTMKSADVFGSWSPANWYNRFDDNWTLRAGITGGIGTLFEDEESAVFIHAGPMLELVNRPTGLRLVARSEPAYISRHTLGSQNLGQDFEFVSALGIFWRPESCHWEAGVAIQHISNAGLSRINPGAQQMVVSLAWSF